jgi:hypothetical protein
MAADGSAAKYIHVLCCLNTASMRCLPWFLDGFIKKIRPLTTRLQTRAPQKVSRYVTNWAAVDLRLRLHRQLDAFSPCYHFTIFQHDLYLLLISLCFCMIYCFFSSFLCISARFTVSSPHFSVFLHTSSFFSLTEGGEMRHSKPLAISCTIQKTTAGKEGYGKGFRRFYATELRQRNS